MLASIHIPLAVARSEDATLVILRPWRSLNDAAFQIASPGVSVRILTPLLAAPFRAAMRLREAAIWGPTLLGFVRSLPVGRSLRLVCHVAERPGWLRPVTEKEREPRQLSTRPSKARLELYRLWTFPQIRKRWRERAKQRSERQRRLQVYFGSDLRRLIDEGGGRASLRGTLDRRGTELAQRFGLSAATPMVALHVREAGFRPAYTGHVERPIDQHRTARIQDYGLAIKELQKQGYTVVRIGDRTMTPLTSDGVVDLTGLPERMSRLLQLWCVSRSRFLFASESGPSELAFLFGVPMLQANVVNLDSNYPIRPEDRYIVKLARSQDGSTTRTLNEMATEEFLYLKQDHIYDDNSPEDLQAAVREMLDELAAPRPPSDAQRAFHTLVSDLLRGSRNVEKFGQKIGHVPATSGRGFICRFFAERHLAVPPTEVAVSMMP